MRPPAAATAASSRIPRSRIAEPVRGAVPRERRQPSDAADQQVRFDHVASRARAVATSIPATATSLLRPAAPETMRTAEGRHVERLAQETRQGLVRGAVDRRRLQPHDERAVPLARQRVPSRPAAAP
jgi:hypothetical protein